MTSDITDYTTANTYLQLLKKEWRSTSDLLKSAQVKKNKLNYAVYFLYKNKDLINKSTEDIAEITGLTRQRVDQIYRQVNKQLQKEGGANK